MMAYGAVICREGLLEVICGMRGLGEVARPLPYKVGGLRQECVRGIACLVPLGADLRKYVG